MCNGEENIKLEDSMVSLYRARGLNLGIKTGATTIPPDPIDNDNDFFAVAINHVKRCNRFFGCVFFPNRN
jgi:hypothetical protein